MAAAVKSKKSASSKAHLKKDKPVNSITPGATVKLNVQETEPGPLQVANISADKRIEDTTGRLERVFMLKQFEKVVKEDKEFLKALCIKTGAKYIESAHAVGQISGNGDGRYIDPLKFLKLMKKKGIKPEDFYEVLSVKIEGCEAFLSGNEIDSVCNKPDVPPGPKFGVEIRKGIPEVTLVEAVNALATQYKPAEVPAPVQE